MRTSYARLFADENGVSHFQDVDIELIPGFAAPPAEPLHFAPLMSVEKCTLVGATPEWRGDAPHPVPRRMLTIVLKGSFEITAGDGTVREFNSGDIILGEDTWGTGHSTAPGVRFIKRECRPFVEHDLNLRPLNTSPIVPALSNGVQNLPCRITPSRRPARQRQAETDDSKARVSATTRSVNFGSRTSMHPSIGWPPLS